MLDGQTLAVNYLTNTILPSLGKIESVEELRDIIAKYVWADVVVELTKLNRSYSQQNMTHTSVTIAPDIFYCYVPLSVVQEWHLTHQKLDRLIIYFEMKVPDVYQVTLAGKRYS